MNYIPLDSYSLFIIPYNTSLFTETNEDGYKTSSISSENDENEDSPEFYKSSGITTNTSTSSPYTAQYVSRQYHLKNHQLKWNTSTLKKENFSDINSEHISPVKEVSSSPI